MDSDHADVHPQVSCVEVASPIAEVALGVRVIYESDFVVAKPRDKHVNLAIGILHESAYWNLTVGL